MDEKMAAILMIASPSSTGGQDHPGVHLPNGSNHEGDVKVKRQIRNATLNFTRPRFGQQNSVLL
jgi:hypothetical protein